MRNRKIQTVERTTKGAKFVMLLSAMSGIGCCVGMTYYQDNPEQMALLFIGSWVSAVVWLFARIWAWWQTG